MKKIEIFWMENIKKKSFKHFSFMYAFETSFVIVVVTHNNFPPYLRRVAVKSLNLLTGYLRPNALPEAD